MNKTVLATLVAAGLAVPALAQSHTYEMRLIADGDAGAPVGAWAQAPIGNPAAVTVTRIGFWLQARVSQTSGTNYGIARVSSPNGGVATIVLTDSANQSSMQRGARNAGGTLHGRGAGYTGSGVNVGATGNSPTSAAFPSGVGNDNGGLDSGNDRIYGFDAYVGATRSGAAIDPEDPGAGYYNPWNINGAPAVAGANGPSVPNGQFSPWANIYRVWVDITSNDGRTIVLSASALVNGTIQTADVGGGLFPLQLHSGQVMEASYSFTVVPTPGAAAMLGLGGLAAMRRRR